MSQSVYVLHGIDTRYKYDGTGCETSGNILFKSNLAGVCNKDTSYKNESAYNITERILNGYLDYLKHLDDSLVYYIGYERDGSPMYVGNMSLVTESDKIYTSVFEAPVNIYSHGLSNQRLRIIAKKKEFRIG